MAHKHVQVLMCSRNSLGIVGLWYESIFPDTTNLEITFCLFKFCCINFVFEDMI
jgi:hypothetical protein